MVEGKHVGYIGKPKTEFPNLLLLIRLQRKNKLSVIHFENGHHASGGTLLIRTMSHKSKAISPNFISGRNIKQAGKLIQRVN